MDSREKFNVKQMIDCETQEPFYPATHALAIQIINELGLVLTLQDVIGTLLTFIQNFGSFSLTDLLLLGTTAGYAYPGDYGQALKDRLDDLEDAILPFDTIVTEGSSKGVTSGAVWTAINNIQPNGEIVQGNNQAVSGGTVYTALYNLLQSLIGGVIEEGNTKYVTGGDIYNYLLTFSPSGNVAPNDSNAVSGDTVYNYLLNNLLWVEKSNNNNTGITQKSTESTLNITNDNEIAVGNYNNSSSDTVFSVGIGESDNSRLNAIEITNDALNSLKIPFGESNSPVSIQSHMRNGLTDIKHLTDSLLLKLTWLINKYVKASFSFSASPLGNNKFYTNNAGIKFSWTIKNSLEQVMTPPELGTPTIYYKNVSQANIIVDNINTGSGNSNINDYSMSNNILEFNSITGTNSLTFAMQILNNTEIHSPDNTLTTTVSLYAPAYIFYVPKETDVVNLEDNFLTNISETTIKLGVPCVLNSSMLLGSITLPDNNSPLSPEAYYIYIAMPQYMFNSTFPNNDITLRFKDKATGIEFNILDEGTCYSTCNVGHTVCNRSITTTYKYVRSAKSLSPGLTWEIVDKRI